MSAKLDHETVEQTTQLQSNRHGDGERDDATLVLVWGVGDLLCAVDVEAIVEILPPVPCRRVPLLPSWVRGLFNHRGTIAPMVDAAGLLGLDPVDDRMANRVLVVRVGVRGAATESSLARNHMTLGIWIHRVLDLARVAFRAAASHPGFANAHAKFLGPVGATPWGLVQLVDPRELLDDAQWQLVAGRVREDAA